MVQWSGNREIKDQGLYSGLVTEICGTSEGTVLQWSEQTEICGTSDGTVLQWSEQTEICRTRDGTGSVVW